MHPMSSLTFKLSKATSFDTLNATGSTLVSFTRRWPGYQALKMYPAIRGMVRSTAYLKMAAYSGQRRVIISLYSLNSHGKTTG
jgi:hypothetical protein